MTNVCYCFLVFFAGSLASWDSLCWIFTLENFTESFTMVLTPQTPRLDRSDSSIHVSSLRIGFAISQLIWWSCSKFDLYPQEETGGEAASSPPESSFQKLAPSETRYTILRRDRDELWPLRPFSDPVTQCHAPGSGRGLGLGQAGGTQQQHPTPLLKSER